MILFSTTLLDNSKYSAILLIILIIIFTFALLKTNIDYKKIFAILSLSLILTKRNDYL